MYPNMQPYTVSIQASPFVSNGHTGTLPAIGTQDVLCIAQTPIGVSHVGAGFVSVAGHGGLQPRERLDAAEKSGNVVLGPCALVHHV